MFARVTTVFVQPDNVSDVTRIYNESILPAVQAASGNQGAMLLTDAATGKGLSITIWETKEAGAAYDASGAYRELVGKVAAYFTAAPTLDTYEITAQG